MEESPQPSSSKTPPTAPAQPIAVANLNYGLVKGGMLGLGWTLGLTSFSVLATLALLCSDFYVFVNPPAFDPRRFLRQGVGIAAPSP